MDYTHRKEDGTVLKVADSLLHEFKTKDGRSVYDGSGIYPDIFIKRDLFANITQTLITKFYIFDYATKYRLSHPKIADPKDFALTDAEYDDFVKYLANKDYTYNTRSEKVLAALKAESTKEKQFDQIQTEYDALKNKMAASKKSDLQLHKQEIKQTLENEIVGRYYFDKGRYEAYFKYDKELAQAVKTMQDKQQLAAILKGDGAYKVIGKPVLAAMGDKKDDVKTKDDQ
jgi:carboxyl-terminal processing protease